MGKLLLCLDGGGIRGAATTQFLQQIEAQLAEHDPLTSLFQHIDMFAGTSTGSIIALGLASGLTAKQINELYSVSNAQEIFTRNKFPDIDGLNEPKYEGQNKTRVLRSKLGSKTLGEIDDAKHVLVVAYDVERRTPVLFSRARFKNVDPDYAGLCIADIADASSAAPTYFPTKSLAMPAHTQNDRWLIDGGVIANNPTMCAISEARRVWPDVPMSDIRVLSVGTGSLTRKINGPESVHWGMYGWFIHGHILDILGDERVVAYQAESILDDGNYVRVNCELREQRGLPDPPDDAMDDVSPANINKLRLLGDFWYKKFGQEAVRLILDSPDSPR